MDMDSRNSNLGLSEAKLQHADLTASCDTGLEASVILVLENAVYLECDTVLSALEKRRKTVAFIGFAVRTTDITKFRVITNYFGHNNNNNNIYLLQLGFNPVAVVMLHVHKTRNWLLLNLSLEGYLRSM